jgi:glucans biosynthesis protein
MLSWSRPRFTHSSLVVALFVATSVSGCGVDTPDRESGTASPATAAGAPGSAALSLATPSSAPASLDALGLAADLQAHELFERVARLAEQRAAEPWQAPDVSFSQAAAELTYGQYRGIRFRDEATIWPSSPFRVQLFHPGSGFRVPVGLSLIEGDDVQLLAFDTARFSYGDELGGQPVALPDAAGHAGFRVLHPLNAADRWDEIIAVLGASYFRLLGPGQVYGLSARGLAVGVASPDGEEFPDFTHHWLVQPPSSAAAPGLAEAEPAVLRWVSLLEGPSVVGAYRFTLRPGQPGPVGDPGAAEASASPTPTELEVETHLFARRDIARLGLAPLTSMYLHGTFDRGGPDGEDVRPRVHDSEGLLMLTGNGEWIWRPLTNRTGVSVTSLRDLAPQGFGLVQRTRDFEAYLDLEARYDRRPSLWVELGEGDWGAGGVELVELPSPSEFNDNIVAHWVPDGGLRAGDHRHLTYRLITFDEPAPALTHSGADAAPARVMTTRVGWATLPGQVDPPPRSHRRVVVDFSPLPRVAGSADDLPDVIVESSSGQVADVRAERLPDGGVRATFVLQAEPAVPADLRLWLSRAEQRVSETWSWLWRSEDDR